MRIELKAAIAVLSAMTSLAVVAWIWRQDCKSKNTTERWTQRMQIDSTSRLLDSIRIDLMYAQGNARTRGESGITIHSFADIRRLVISYGREEYSGMESNMLMSGCDSWGRAFSVVLFFDKDLLLISSSGPDEVFSDIREYRQPCGEPGCIIGDDICSVFHLECYGGK